jgi:chromosome partitioning protein
VREGESLMKKDRFISVDAQKIWGATNEMKARDTSVVTPTTGAPQIKKAGDIPVNTQKWVSNEMKASDTSVVIPTGDPLMKKARDIAFATRNGGAINEKKARDIAVDTQKWGVSNEKKARDIAVDTQKGRATNEKKARVISVVTQKGGVGKTATAINMSVGLHNLGYKVAAIDLDPQGQLAEGFGISRKSLKKTMFDVLLGMVQMKDIKQKAYGVDLYLSNRTLAELGVTVQTLSNLDLYPDPYVLLKQALAQIDTKYDFIIIDTPPTVSIFNKNALNASTDAVIPMQPEGMAVKGAEDMLEFIREVQKSSNKKLNVLGILATMVQNTNLHNTIMQDIRKSFIETDVTVFDTIIKRTIRYGLAQTDGVPDTRNFPEYTEFLKEALFSETA